MRNRISNALLLLFMCLAPISNAQMVSNDPSPEMEENQQDSPEIDAEQEMEKRISRGDLLNPKGASAFDTYKNFVDRHPSDNSYQRKLKRTLVAGLAEASDEILTEYFDEGGEFILKYMSANFAEKHIPIDQYYFVAADLLGAEHYLYGSLKAKGCFIEALKMRYIENNETKEVNQKLEQSMALDPLASYTYNELGQIYFEEEDYSMACEKYNYAIKLNPNWKMPLENLEIAKEALAIIASKNKKG